jgi:hypothetical protein
MNRHTPKLPLANRDIAARVRRGYLIRAGAVFVWCAILYSGVYNYEGGFILDETHPGVILVFALIIGVLFPVWLLRLYKAVSDRGWSGVVKEAFLVDKAAPANPLDRVGATAAEVRNMMSTLIELTVECPGGKLIVKQYKLNPKFGEHIDKYYSKGDAVYMFPGVKYPKKATNSVRVGAFTYTPPQHTNKEVTP